MRFSALILATPLLLASCAMGPNYQRPTVDTPPDWRWKTAEPRDSSDKGPWWELFNDPDLNRLQTDALQNNQTLRAAVARVDQARARARISQADLFPTLNATPSWQRYRTSSNASVGPFTQPSLTANTFRAPIDLSYEIDLWGKVRRGFEASQNEFLASAAAYQNILFTLQSDVAVAYYQLRGVDHEIAILERAVKLREDGMTIFQKRFDTGATSELDLSTSKVQLAGAQADLAEAHRRRAEFQNTLAVLCGQPTSNFELGSSLISLTPPAIAPGLPSELLERRPDVAEAERKLAARNAEIGVAYTAFFPSISLTAGGGFQSVALKDLFDWSSHIWSFGPTINIPLFAGGRNAAALKEARAAYEEALALYRQSILVAFQDVDNALAGLRFLQEQSTFQNQALVAARKAADISTARYQNGVVNYLDVIDAERTRLDSELQDVRIRSQQMTTTVLLVKAIGGGWNQPPTSLTKTKTKP
jgi:outer membrane protein, multidrug efflux system